jgi:hypothetical protein
MRLAVSTRPTQGTIAAKANRTNRRRRTTSDWMRCMTTYLGCGVETVPAADRADCWGPADSTDWEGGGGWVASPRDTARGNAGGQFQQLCPSAAPARKGPKGKESRQAVGGRSQAWPMQPSRTCRQNLPVGEPRRWRASERKPDVPYKACRLGRLGDELLPDLSRAADFADISEQANSASRTWNTAPSLLAMPQSRETQS